MSEATPPSEQLPIFNPANFPDSQPSGIGGGGGGGSFLNFPVAQGIENFPSGITFGDGSYENTADADPADQSQAPPFNEITFKSWPTPNVNINPYAATEFWCNRFVGAGGPGDAGFGAGSGSSLMYRFDYRTNNAAITVNAANILQQTCDGFAGGTPPYSAVGYQGLDTSETGEIVAVIQGGTQNQGIYAFICCSNLGDTFVSSPDPYGWQSKSIGTFACSPQTVQVSSSGKYITASMLYNSTSAANNIKNFQLVQSSDYGQTATVIFDSANLTLYADFWDGFRSPLFRAAVHAQSKNGQVIYIAYQWAGNNPAVPNTSVTTYGFLSKNFGRTFDGPFTIHTAASNVDSRQPTDIAMSANGQCIYISYRTGTSGGLMWSTKYGEEDNWSDAYYWLNSPPNPAPNAPPGKYFGLIEEPIDWVCCSGGGQKIICGIAADSTASTFDYYWGANGPRSMTVAQNGYREMSMNASGQSVSGAFVGTNFTGGQGHYDLGKFGNI